MIFAYIALSLLLFSLGAKSQNPATDPLNGFSYELFQDAMQNENGNFIFSPISVGTLLAVLERVSGGKTNQQLRKALQYPPKAESSVSTVSQEEESYRNIIQELTYKNSGSTNILEFASQLFTANSLRLNFNFLNIISTNFFITPQKLDFQNSAQAAYTINNWVSENTRGKITSLVGPGSITRDTKLILTNAIYFHGIWDKKFDINHTMREAFFVDPDRSGTEKQLAGSARTEVFMMKQLNKFVAGRDESMRAKWVHLPFHNNEFSMVLVMPTDNEGINGLSRRLTKENFYKIINTKTIKTVVLGLPRFKISTQISIEESLKRLGVKEIFGPTADLKTISNDVLFVNKILHKAEIEVNEEGSTAAAASAVLVNTLSLIDLEELKFYANQPFLVILMKNNPTYPLFVGRVVNP